MSPSHLFPLAALAGAVLLLFHGQSRIPAVFAAAAAGLELLLTSGVISMNPGRFPLRLALAAVLLAAGVFAHFRASAKSAVTAATLVSLVGLYQVATLLRP